MEQLTGSPEQTQNALEGSTGGNADVSNIVNMVSQAMARQQRPDDAVTKAIKMNTKAATMPQGFWPTFAQGMLDVAQAQGEGLRGKSVADAYSNIKAKRLAAAEKAAQLQLQQERVDNERQTRIMQIVNTVMTEGRSRRREKLQREQLSSLNKYRDETLGINRQRVEYEAERLKFEKKRVENLDRTPLQKNMEYLVDKYGMSPQQALRTLKPPKQQTAKGLTVPEAYNSLLEYKSYKDSGQPIPPEVHDRAVASAHILKQPRFIKDAQDNVMQFTPGVPQGFPIPTMKDMEPPGQEVGQGPQTEMFSKKAGKSIQSALDTVGDILGILETARKNHEQVTGIAGWTKRNLGGYARQAGVPVSPLASSLSRKLELLKTLIAPETLRETRLSNEERARLDKIVGSVSPGMDEIELTMALDDVVTLLERAHAGQSQ